MSNNLPQFPQPPTRITGAESSGGSVEMTEEQLRRFRPHIVVHLGGKRYELNPDSKPETKSG